jgi:GH43 family beta-xylosidase
MDDTYLNPVYPHSCPDPFVLKYRGEYWAYCTGRWHDGRCFGVLRSRDLVAWQPVAGAMEPLPDERLGEAGVSAIHYWAPEVTYDNGRFYMYYSVGNEAHMQIRVAVAEHPAGPFADSGRRLTSEPFAIDAHVFVDDDGRRYLFYATDYLDHSHVGTGTARDLLIDPYTLAGHPTPVTRPRYDWHVYDPQRAEKGGVRWHTIEGSFVLKRKGRYYQMFSGGNWQNVSYGVSYAVSDTIDTPAEWTQTADGEQTLPILRTLPGQVIGPGHNSVVRGPDNQQLFCVYHRWAGEVRALAIDPLDWAGARMLVLGPSNQPRPAPLGPTCADFFDAARADGLGPGWRCAGGRWLVMEGAAHQTSADGAALAERDTLAESFVAEVSLRASGDPGAVRYGLALGDQLMALLAPAQSQLVVRLRHGAEWAEEQVALPLGFDARADHLLRVEVDAGRAAVMLDHVAARWSGRLAADRAIGTIALASERGAAAFAGFALTAAWQDLFEEQGVTPADLGWRAEVAGWNLAGRQLRFSGARGSIAKGPPLESYELVVNARLESQEQIDGCYGFYPALQRGALGPLLAVEAGGDGWALRYSGPDGEQYWQLPTSFDPYVYQQFRFRKQAERVAIAWETHELGAITVPPGPASVGLYARTAAVAFDMVRVTAIGSA